MTTKKTEVWNRDESNEVCKKVVMFDFDGTIVDSMSAFADIASEVMPKYYSVTKNDARRMYIETSGVPFFQQLEQLFPNNPQNSAAADEFEKTKLKDYLEKGAFEDVASTIDTLRRNGITTVVSSNNFQELVDAHVEKIGIKFDIVLGFKPNFAKGKDHFDHIEQKLGTNPDEIIFVGDSIKDGERALSCGVNFIGKEGTFPAERFKKTFPEAGVISSISELVDILVNTETQEN